MQVVLALYSFVGTFSIGQLELVLNRVLLKLADGGWWQSHQNGSVHGAVAWRRSPWHCQGRYCTCGMAMQCYDS
jgi:hypothetical protein